MSISTIRQFVKREWTWLKLSYSFLFAHHPTCDRYADQVFDLFGIRLCQGCTISTLSTIAVTTTLAILSLSFSPLLFIGGITSALIFIGLVDGKNLGRVYKRIARMAIGLVGGTLIYLVIFEIWLIRGIALVCAIAILLGYKKVRQLSPSPDLCITCPQLPKAPYCDGIEEKMIANKNYRSLILPMTESSMEERIETLRQNYLTPAELQTLIDD